MQNFFFFFWLCGWASEPEKFVNFFFYILCRPSLNRPEKQKKKRQILCQPPRAEMFFILFSYKSEILLEKNHYCAIAPPDGNLRPGQSQGASPSRLGANTRGGSRSVDGAPEIKKEKGKFFINDSILMA